MLTRRLLAPLAAAALAVTAIAGAGVANAEDADTSGFDLGGLDLGSLDLNIPGAPNLSVSVDYKCVASGEGEDASTTAHILTTVTNIGSGTADNVATFTHAPTINATTAQHAVSIAAGESIVYDLDTNVAALAGAPVFALTYASGLDSNPFNNVAVSMAPAGCAAPETEGSDEGDAGSGGESTGGESTGGENTEA